MPLRERLKSAVKDVLEEIQNRVDGVSIQHPSRMSCPSSGLPSCVCVSAPRAVFRKSSEWNYSLREPLLERKIIPGRLQSIIENTQSSAWSSLPPHFS